MIQLKNISKHFGAVAALHPTDLNIKEGQTTVLIGPSGCGKSTILRLIVGLLEPTSGYVQLNGERVSPANILEMRRRMGYVIQDGGLFPHLTAAQNVTLMAKHINQSAEEIQYRLEELCSLTHFPEDGLSRYPVELSGGQQQRVSLMRALMLDPEVLLLDEPLGALDPMVRASLQADLREIFQTLGKTVVMVTHDIGEAGFFSSDIILMREGRIIQQGTLEQLYSSPADEFVRLFINAQRLPLEIFEGVSR